MTVPAHWPRWTCPGCGETLTGPSQARELRCGDCRKDDFQRRAAKVDGTIRRAWLDGLPVAQRPEQDRADVLELNGWPGRYARRPFEVPTWLDPAEPRHPSHVDDGWKAELDPMDPRTYGDRVRSCLWVGKVGVGKSMFGHELAWRFWCSGRSIGFTTAPGLVTAVWNDDPAPFRADVLMVDDVDRGVAGQGLEGLFAAIERRHSAGSITLGTSNHSLADLYGKHSALADRWRPGLIVPVRAVDDMSRRGL